MYEIMHLFECKRKKEDKCECPNEKHNRVLRWSASSNNPNWHRDWYMIELGRIESMDETIKFIETNYYLRLEEKMLDQLKLLVI